jgi:hypothetical protein
MSGECLCGAFGRASAERAEIARWFPAVEASFAALESAARTAGLWHASRWGHRPLQPVMQNQLDFTGATIEERLCRSCALA